MPPRLPPGSTTTKTTTTRTTSWQVFLLPELRQRARHERQRAQREASTNGRCYSRTSGRRSSTGGWARCRTREREEEGGAM
eukprot:493688-Hanusia_phi.AAC.1